MFASLRLKFERLIFYLLIFSIPFQTRLIIRSWGLPGYGNLFSEYNSVFFYFTDILIGLLLIGWILRSKLIKKGQRYFSSVTLWLFGFFFIAFLSLFKASNTGVTLYQFVKLAEFIFLFFYLKSNFSFFNFRKILGAFVASGVFQALLAAGQFFSQSDLGLKHFEPGKLGADISGVATFWTNGVKVIRAYGTFPHPNVLAAFLLVSIFSLYILYLFRSKKFESNLGEGILDILLAVLILGIFLTFSRTILFVFVLLNVFLFLYILVRHFKKRDVPAKKALGFFLLLIVFGSLLTVLFWPEISSRLELSLSDQAVGLRVFYTDTALFMMRDNPFLGVGMGNFVWRMGDYFKHEALNLEKYGWVFQPVHNIYLLIASEIGLIGLILFAGFLFSLIRNIYLKIKNNVLVPIFLSLIFCFLFIAFFDHFFWTLQQGRLMFWIILAIISGLSLTSPHSSTDRTQVSGT